MCSKPHQFRLQSGTSVVTLVTPEAIWIAADSKMKDGDKGSTYQMKIGKTEDKVYAFAGVTNIIDNATDKPVFNAFELMDSILSKEKKIEVAVEVFVQEWAKEIQRLLPQCINQDPQKLEYLKKYPILTFFISCFTEHGPLLIYRGYEVYGSLNDMGMRERFRNQMVVSDSAKNFFWPFGQIDNIIQYLEKNPSYLVGLENISQKLTCLINVEAEKNAQHVGMPVNIVCLTRKGAEWYRDLKCLNQ